MQRREFISLLGGAAAAWPLAARAQQPARYRIGHLAIAAPTDTPPPPPANWDAFVQGLREAGYIEGQNIAFEHRSAHDQPELFPKLALDACCLDRRSKNCALVVSQQRWLFDRPVVMELPPRATHLDEPPGRANSKLDPNSGSFAEAFFASN